MTRETGHLDYKPPLIQGDLLQPLFDIVTSLTIKKLRKSQFLKLMWRKVMQSFKFLKQVRNNIRKTVRWSHHCQVRWVKSSTHFLRSFLRKFCQALVWSRGNLLWYGSHLRGVYPPSGKTAYTQMAQPLCGTIREQEKSSGILEEETIWGRKGSQERFHSEGGGPSGSDGWAFWTHVSIPKMKVPALAQTSQVVPQASI